MDSPLDYFSWHPEYSRELQRQLEQDAKNRATQSYMYDCRLGNVPQIVPQQQKYLKLSSSKNKVLLLC